MESRRQSTRVIRTKTHFHPVEVANMERSILTACELDNIVLASTRTIHTSHLKTQHKTKDA